MPAKTILVVEDDEFIRENIVEILTLKNYNVIFADDGSKGLILALKNKPDLIISDVNMPVMDGWELLNNVRNNKEISNTPFLFLTAMTAHTNLRKGMDLGADDYLIKPFTIEDLLSAIHIRLERQIRIQAELDEKIEQLTNRLNRINSHEYNTPLNGILGFADLILSNFESFPSERIKEFVTKIQISGNRLKRTIDKTSIYNDFSNLKNEDVVKMKARLDYYTIKPNEVEQLIIPFAEKFNRTQDLNVNLASATINLDDKYTTFIIEELIDNAFAFSKPGTLVEVTGMIENDKYSFSVYNIGRGFKPEDIIAPYLQFDRDLFEQQGSGLGLYNIKTICNLFDIGFDIDSVYNEYAKVTISFKIIDITSQR